MKRIFSLLAVSITALTMQAQYLNTPVEIWPEKVPDSEKPKAPVTVNPESGHFTQVTSPTLEEFRPEGDNKLNQAIVVCPGGGYQILAYQHEGVQIAQWLAGQGYTAYLLAYRIPNQRKGALQDIFRAIRTVRSKGFEKVGAIGFSAGASLCCRASTRWGETLYPTIDKIDKESQRPDFAMLIYPAYLADGPEQTLTPELTVTKDTSPLFVFGTQDDHYSGPSCTTILPAMQKAGAPIELHFLEKGGHGYGMQGEGAGRIWPLLAEEWLKTQR